MIVTVTQTGQCCGGGHGHHQRIWPGAGSLSKHEVAHVVQTGSEQGRGCRVRSFFPAWPPMSVHVWCVCPTGLESRCVRGHAGVCVRVRVCGCHGVCCRANQRDVDANGGGRLVAAHQLPPPPPGPHGRGRRRRRGRGRGRRRRRCILITFTHPPH
jgi:hypothetical protein